MAYTLNSSGFDTEVQSCSKNCVKAYEKLQKQFDEQRQTLSKANLEVVAYQLGLESVEAQLVVHQKKEAVYKKKIAVLEFKVKDKSNTMPTANKTSASVSQVEENIPPPIDASVEIPRVESGISNEKVNTVRVNGVNTVGQTAVSTVKGTGVTAVKASAGCVWRPKMTNLNNVSKDNSGSWVSKRGNPQQALKNKGIFDSGCSMHMTGNKDFLTDYQDIDGGFVAFGGSARGGKATQGFLEINEFCGLKGIKREFSVARTPQQNGVAERKNRTLIEAARTMLADSLLSTIFWAEQLILLVIPPSISFMRPFGCLVTILNTLDPLGQGPNWLFDIDSLTNSMNYQPVTAGNQTNKNAGPQEANGDTGLKKSVDARQSEEKNVSTQQYIVFPLWSSISSSYKSSDETYKNDTADDAAGETPVQKPASENEQTLKNVLDKMIDQEKEATEQSDAVRKEFEAQCNRQHLSGKSTRASSTNSFNTVSTPVNTAGGSRIFEADFNNMEPSTVVSPIPTTRLHSIHPKDQIIRDPKSAVQTRGMTKKSFGEHAMISYIQKQRRSNHKDFQNYLFACFLSQQEPTKIAQALDDESWVEAMQEELL
ncbi:ribonuclease H-like domain-containing protein [Tanacetum coccineum]